MPDVARKVFQPDRLPLAEAYTELLATEGVVRGLIGPREAPRLWDRHILNCAVLGELLPENATVADIGSGAGLPGLVLAIHRPDLRMTLIEPLLRRTTFLTEVVEQLGLDNVEVVRGRADLLHGKRTFEVVTSRAVAPLGRLLEWSMPLVAAPGALVAMKGSSITTEIEEVREVLDAFGCAEPTISTLGEGLLEETTLAVRVAWADPTKVGLTSVPAAVRRRQGASQGGKQKARTKRRKNT
ncbi:16S rRNA (guanine(527)-N(7))-methyltransferase RsmG [Nocardioides nematodiphilus]|uniref:16S rRNA (guanine(527)-N(7))-methyltransferase RsmG n=1 Tax=Nocardioides nematodiphilus TaxID=2849669 RepID=UPI001CDA369A|nr:16S rRNA (guanine(527)-N(7))-methyltransferase RsmG [Nocardioides nematodiphilus]MCA1984375.1 16S rRNA (guanine(527)-N(7))-methyltransferase RsmG [Nocardioides nematodiphilus]